MRGAGFGSLVLNERFYIPGFNNFHRHAAGLVTPGNTRAPGQQVTHRAFGPVRNDKPLMFRSDLRDSLCWAVNPTWDSGTPPGRRLATEAWFGSQPVWLVLQLTICFRKMSVLAQNSGMWSASFKVGGTGRAGYGEAHCILRDRFPCVVCCLRGSVPGRATGSVASGCSFGAGCGAGCEPGRIEPGRIEPGKIEPGKIE